MTEPRSARAVSFAEALSGRTGMDEAREAAKLAWTNAVPVGEREWMHVYPAFDAGWDAGVTWAREQHQPRPIIACGGCGMRTDGVTADGSFICPHCFAVNRGDQSFSPGQYRQARGIAPPDSGEPSVETIRAMRDEP